VISRRGAIKDIAAAVRCGAAAEILTDLSNPCGSCGSHYGGTVGSFTGDGIWRLGAPVALEATRSVPAAGLGRFRRGDAACLDVKTSAGVKKKNCSCGSAELGSGIAGNMGRRPFGYTTLVSLWGWAADGAVAATGWVMISASTADSLTAQRI